MNAAQLSFFERTALQPAEVVEVIGCGPIVHASDDGKTVYTVNGAYLNRWRRAAKGWNCEDCQVMPADLYRITVAAAMTLAETWHRESALPEDREEAPPLPAKRSRLHVAPPTKTLTDRQRELLANFEVTEKGATFKSADHIEDWAAVKEVFIALGAKWRTGKPGRFVFAADDDGEAKVRLALETGEILDPRAAGFFPTPLALARELVGMAGIAGGSEVLEPSAGRGALADIARERGGVVTCCEFLPENAERLRKLGYVVHETDFLALSPAKIGRFDAVVMNPPFAKGADIAHVEHALSFLRPGGTLAAVLSAGARFREDAKSTAFRARVQSLGGRFEDVPAGTFKESGTMVATCTLVVKQGGNP